LYKVIFADDETLVRSKISAMVDWNSAGFCLVACCANGYELMEQMEKDMPDLVILDINMPFINGIEAARQIRHSYPYVKLVFLTSYADFDYAQQAVELNAMKYIIKPASAQELLKVLMEARDALDAEKERVRRMAELEHSYRCNNQMLMQDILSDVAKSDTIYERAESCGFEWTADTAFQVAVFSPDRTVRGTYWDNVPEHTLLYALYNVTAELAENEQIGCVQVHGDVVSLIGTAPAETLESKMQEFSQSILQVVSTRLHFTVTSGLGEVCRGCANIAGSFAEVERALKLRARHGGNRLFTAQDLQQTFYGHTAVRDAMNYIETAYADPNLSADSVCEQLHISPSYLRALFKQQTGLSIIGYITKARMERSKSLLEEEGLKNYRIAELTGYSDPHYFGYCFKRYFGITPMEMRAKMGQPVIK
jgi:two-component system, response regulator YesN